LLRRLFVVALLVVALFGSGFQTTCLRCVHALLGKKKAGGGSVLLEVAVEMQDAGPPR
jgi:hypothetical protein